MDVSWTIKKTEHQRIDAFKLWCWRRLLRVPWSASKSNQFIIKEISVECSMEGLMLKLKLQYFGYLMQRTDSWEKTLVLLGRKAMTNIDRMLKSRDITLPTKVHLVKAMVFPGVMYGCENWTIKKAEHQRIDAFELWWWRLNTTESGESLGLQGDPTSPS